MKAFVLMLLTCLAGAAFAGDAPSSLEDAKRLAESQNKPLLIEFFHPN